MVKKNHIQSLSQEMTRRAEESVITATSRLLDLYRVNNEELGERKTRSLWNYIIGYSRGDNLC